MVLATRNPKQSSKFTNPYWSPENMAEPIGREEEEELTMEGISRKEKRKAMKKNKRKQIRKEIALKERQEEEAKLNDPEEQARLELLEREEAQRIERDRKEFEERERKFLEELEMKKKIEAEQLEEQERVKALQHHQVDRESDCEDDGDWEYVDGPAEFIWKGNEITFEKKRIKVPKKDAIKEDNSRPTSNPLPPQTEAFADYKDTSKVSAKQMLENVAQQVPNFGTELDKAHCPFHFKTGACRFGQRCSRAHFYPDKSCTLLIKNMYSGPGITLEQDEGLEVCNCCLHVILQTDEEVEHCFEEFYEDVHTEFLKFGEIVNFKVCRNGAFHLRGNVYIHYKSLDSAVLAFQSINGRYFAGKQISCEFINVTKWKVAICGEYMKSRFKTCSHGTACNFIHCFRNPGGDYEWADWDKPPPRYWIKKMIALFGYSDESGHEKRLEQEHSRQMSCSRMMTPDVDRHYSKRSRYKEMDWLNDVATGGSWDDKNDAQTSNKDKGRMRDKDNDEKMYIKPFDHHSIDSHSDGYRSDRDREDRSKKKDRHHSRGRKSSRSRHSKKETGENDSSEDLSDRDKYREAHHGHSRKGSRKRSRSHRDDYDYDDRNRDRYHARGKKESSQRNEVSRSPNEYSCSRKRGQESDSSGGHCSESSDREGHQARSRKGSRKWDGGDDSSGRRKTRRSEWDELSKDRDGESSRQQRKKTRGTKNDDGM